MGGLGGGRPTRRLTIDGCRSLSLDVLQIMRPWAPLLARHTIVRTITLPSWHSTWSRGGEPYAQAELELTILPGSAGGWLRLRHDDVHGYGHPPQDYRIQLDASRPGFGGLQWWFFCPLTGRRCRKLFLPNGGPVFACRQAYRLHYGSQAEGPVERARRRIRRVSRGLGGDGSASLDDLPPKPKGMHRSTYRRMQEQAWGAQEVVDTAFCGWASRFVARRGR